jgi:uncharacterized UBP type Zn finger protein
MRASFGFSNPNYKRKMVMNIRFPLNSLFRLPQKVLQQLYNVPGLCDTILGNDEEAEEETILHQLQSVFGHLLSSKLKYHIPEKFWQTFRLFGQPVNVREQQDAFEFYTQIIDQVDEFLMSRKKPKTFPTFFEGIFSDQKICQECPHRYERYFTYYFLICNFFRHTGTSPRVEDCRTLVSLIEVCSE